MNISQIIYFLGSVLNLEGAAMLLPFAVGLIYGENAAWSYLIGAGICILVGLPLIIKKPKKTNFYAKEGFITVALSWIVMSLLGAIPFVLSKDMPSFLTAFFETVSGFTTTGASNLIEVESMSRAGLFWRSETHWLGGLGVIVFVLAVLNLKGGYSIQLLRAESPGPSTDKLKPRLRYTAMILYIIYTVLTLMEIFLLLMCKIPLFDAITTSFGTAGTGGFSVRNLSIGAYANPSAEWVIGIFMVIFGVNFNIFYLFIKRRFKEAFSDEEFRAYLIIVLSTTALVVLNIHTMFPSFKDSLRTGFFTVSSIISSTGFSTVDFNTWPEFSRLMLVLIMFCGACAGSTGGGMKVVRIIVLVKASFKEVAHAIHPRSVNTVKFNKRRVSDEALRGILTYFAIEMALIAGSCILVSLDNFDTTTTVTAVITCFHNIGPGLNSVGPAGNFSDFSAISKLVLSFDMLAGRLELMPLLVLLSPASWRKA